MATLGMVERRAIARDLSIILLSIKGALKVCEQLLDPTSERTQQMARLHWIAQIKEAIDDSHEFCGVAQYTMQMTIDSLLDDKCVD